jgi:hypothetical protein
MNDNDIIRMALKHFGAVLKPSDLEVKLAALAVAKEREACAKVCESLRDSFLSPRYATGQPMSSIRERFAAGRCAELIRARGET